MSPIVSPIVCNIPRLILSFTFVNPPCVCDRGDSSCSNKGKFDDDDDDDSSVMNSSTSELHAPLDSRDIATNACVLAIVEYTLRSFVGCCPVCGLSCLS